MDIENAGDIHAYAVGLIDRYPEAAAVAVAFGIDCDGDPCTLATAVVICDDRGRPITRERIALAARRGADLREMQAIAAIRACRTARQELDRVLAGG